MLEPEAVDRLRAAAGTIIMDSPEFKRLLKDFGAKVVTLTTGSWIDRDIDPATINSVTTAWSRSAELAKVHPEYPPGARVRLGVENNLLAALCRTPLQRFCRRRGQPVPP